MSKEIRVVEFEPILDFEDLLGHGHQDQEHPAWLTAVKTTKVYVDAKMAANMLLRNIEPAVGVKDTNRRSYNKLVVDFSRIMLDGGWNFNHQGLAFNDQGRCVDGAHRLKALLLAAETEPDISVPFMITIGLPAESIKDIDVTRRRSLPDVLTMQGHANTMLLGALARLTYLYDNAQFDRADFTYWDGTRPSRNALEAQITANADLYAEAIKVGLNQRVFVPTAFAAMWVIVKQKQPDADIDKWVSQLRDGEMIGNGDPAYAVRRWAFNQKHDGNTAPGWEQLAYLLKAFAKFRRGETVGIILWKPKQEPFPRP